MTRLFILASLVALIMSADGLIAQISPAASSSGMLVDIGGHRLHLRCVGPAGKTPTVVLEAGGGGTSTTWSRVQDVLSARVRTCAYDRAGSGSSEQGPSPRTMRQAVLELHALLHASNEPGPFVLVGHSFGSIIVRLYLEQYDTEVAGMVLVDPTHESEVLFSVREGRWARIRNLASDRAVPEPRLGSAIIDPAQTAEDYLAEELQGLYLARIRNPQPLGIRPLIVLGAGRRPAPPGTTAEQWNPMRAEKDEQRVDSSRLSRSGKFILDPASSHEIQMDNPELVARAIEEVWAEAGSR